MCVWCSRWRLVELHTWASARTRQQLCGEVCGHCYYGTGAWDDCRTCRARDARGVKTGATGVRAIGRADVLALLAQRFGQKRQGPHA
jgi:hypothetical protein